MAEHKKIGSLLRTTAAGARQFPRRRYYGFLIGSGFRNDLDAPIHRFWGGPEHGTVMLRNAGNAGDVILSAGDLVLTEGDECAPLIESLTWSENVQTCHVIGLTSPAELAAARPGPRPPWHYRTNADIALPSVTSVILPWAGRRHGVVRIRAIDTAIDVTFLGKHYTGSGASENTPLGATVTIAAGSASALHIGGTDSAELFDEVEVGLDPDSAGCDYRMAVDISGEAHAK